MKRRRRLGLGMGGQARQKGIDILDQLFCTLALALNFNMRLCWLAAGSTLGDLLEEKREVTWQQLCGLGRAVARLGKQPTTHPLSQHQLAWVKYRPSSKGFGDLLTTDLNGENVICSRLRCELAVLQKHGDWSNFQLLTGILSQREELVWQIENVLELETVLEHIWDGEQPTMGSQWPGPMH